MSFPGGARAALSFTFDDARVSQLDVGLPILDRHGVRATFYVLPSSVRPRADDWRRASAAHEIGSHTARHPMTANQEGSGDHALEMYTRSRMQADLARGDEEIDALLGVRPRTFAYPGGNTLVGSGVHSQSYVPLIARRYLAGRGFRSQNANDPDCADLARLDAAHVDGFEFTALRALVDEAVAAGSWLVLVAHEVGDSGRWSISADALDELCGGVAAEPRVWVAPVVEVAEHVRATRKPRSHSELRRQYLGARARLAPLKRRFVH